MIDKYLISVFGTNKSYKKRPWYKDLKQSILSYGKGIVYFFLSLFMIISFSLLVYSFFCREPLFILFNLVSLAISLFIFLYVRNKGIDKTIQRITMAVCLLTFSSCFFMPRIYHIFLIFFSCSPVLAVEIVGHKEGRRYTLVLVFIALVCLGLGHEGFIPGWDNGFSLIQHSFAIFALILVFTLVFFFRMQYYRYLKHFLYNILFDKSTDLPKQRVLNNIINPGKNYIFTIIQTVNFTELGLIFGYELSDNLLDVVAMQLKTKGEELDFLVFKLRGNDFGVLKELNSINIQKESQEFLEELYKDIKHLSLNWKKTVLKLNFVIGGTIITKDNQDQFLSQADIALKDGLQIHQAVNIFYKSSQIRDIALEHLNNYSILKDNIEKMNLHVHFQPIVNSQTGIPICYETLLRIQNNQGKLESPEKYLGMAESTGMDREISNFVLLEACKAIELLEANISVNITLNDLLRPEFLVLLKANYKPEKAKGYLILEILERQELHTLPVCQKFLEEVRTLGCLVAIDDFGSGYSNFTNILKIPIDIIKIDGSLIQQMKTNERAGILVENIIQFSKQLNLKTVAEYVDTEELALSLKSSGVDYFQGWFFSKAKPLAELKDYA